MNVVDNARIELACPHCRHKIPETIGKLKGNPQLTCPSCRKSFLVDANQLRTAAQKVEKAMAEIQRSLQRLGK